MNKQEFRDLNWLRNHITTILGGEVKYKDKNAIDDRYYIGLNNAYVAVLDFLDSLEVVELSPDWIEEYSYNIEEYWEAADMMDSPQIAVSVENLEKLLVPKREITEEQAWRVIADKYKHDVMYWEYAKQDFMKTQGKLKVPKCVDEWFEENDIFYSGEFHHDLMNLIGDTMNANEDEKTPIQKYMSKVGSVRTIVDAYRYGYEVISVEEVD